MGKDNTTFRQGYCFGQLGMAAVILWCLVFLTGCGVLTPPFRGLGSKTAPLVLVETPSLSPFIGHDDLIWTEPGTFDNRMDILASVDHSLAYLRSDRAATDYRKQPAQLFGREHILRSLLRFKEILATSRNADDVRIQVRSEFDFYRAVGQKGKRDVLFTGYCEPLIDGSFLKSPEFRYPLFKKPADYDSWKAPHPRRRDLVGFNGLGEEGAMLRGQELVYLRDRIDVAMIQIQGSGRIRLPEGGTVGVGFDGATAYPFVSIAAALIRDGKITAAEASMPRIKEYFRRNPAELDHYMTLNDRFVFFRLLGANPPVGSIGVPVVAERSIATDKSLFPPGALAIFASEYPVRASDGQLRLRPTSRFVLDQDTGSAIKGPGRVDIFVGTGDESCSRAGIMKSIGALYYPVLKDRKRDDKRN